MAKVFLQFPNAARLDKLSISERDIPLSYDQVEGTKVSPISGFNNDLTRQAIGKGEALWQKSKQHLLSWKHYPSDWVKVIDNNPDFVPNNLVSVYFKMFGIWWWNSCRIIYSIDEDNRFGFAYGTLENHVEKGEELFLLERDSYGNVFYSIKAFSLPNKWYVWLGYPLARIYQRQFVKESMAIMATLGKRYN